MLNKILKAVLIALAALAALLIVGIVGGIDNGESLNNMWYTLPCLIYLFWFSEYVSY